MFLCKRVVMSTWHAAADAAAGHATSGTAGGASRTPREDSRITLSMYVFQATLGAGEAMMKDGDGDDGASDASKLGELADRKLAGVSSGRSRLQLNVSGCP